MRAGQGSMGLLGLLLVLAGVVSAAPSAPVALAPSTAVAQPSTPIASSGNSTGLITEFVQRSGTRFVVQSADGKADSCQTFYFAGANAQFLMVFAADPAKRPIVLEILDSAQQLGLTVLRMWTFADGPTTFNSLQRYPGQYDEGTLTGLDFVLDEASKRGIRLVFVFANYWSQYGGVDQYNVWSFQAGTGTCNGDTVCRDEFFSDPMAAQYYRDHVKTILTRTNSLNGRLYREDPTIFGYNLMNEPRSQQDLYLVQRVTTDALQQPYNLSYNQGNDLQQWIEDMAGYVKSIDPIHLLTIGSEGFAGNYTPMYLYANPGAWGSLLGVDFVRNHAISNLDYATMHVYVDQWLCTADGATEDGQLAFMNEWLDAHQQAAEEDLMMPVVLEEFGSKLNARSGQYQTAYQSCLESANRGGGCAGVMFWDLTHEGYSLVDPWLDGQLRFGGGYSNWVNTTDPDRQAILNMASSYANSVAKINAASAGTSTCVFYPPPAMGQGCKNLDVNLELGGLPWTCLEGEPTGLNWCNAADAASIYRDPPQAWLSTNGRELPYNTIEGLILGNLTNNGSTPINLNGAWIIVPYSMGVQTQFEGVWERIEDPNQYFTVYCWYLNGDGQDLCNGGVDVSFTNFTWPMGTKHDRGVNISFTGDIMLQPGSSINTQGGSTQVMLSFKDATHAFRLDVSDLGIDGALNCPEDVLYATYPPPNPPAPIPCTEGPTPNRGCPSLEWYFNSPTANTSTVATSSITNAGRRLAQNTGGSSDGTSGLILADPPVSIVNPGPVPGNPINVTTAPLTNVFSVSKAVNGSSVGFMPGTQYIVTAHISSLGNPRVTELISPVAGTTATNAADTPHTDALGDGSNVLGTTVYLVMSFIPAGYSSVVYRVLAGGAVPTNDPTGGYFKGVFELDWNTNVTAVQFFAESPLAGLQISLTDVSLTAPALVSTQPNKLPLPAANITDVYSPCTLPQNSGNDAIYVVNLPAGQSDTLNAALCSPGGYYQSVRVYNNGKEILRTDPGGVPSVYALNNIKIAGGSDFVFVIMGSLGDPYGSYRGQPGIRFTWASGRAFEGIYDAAPVNISNFVRVDEGNLMLGCDRAAYVGCNTWDLMDKSRYTSDRPEVESRMDAMVQAGWKVGRTWGFSLGDGTGQTALGETVLDPSSILEPAPGVYNEEVWESLDFVLAQAATRNLRLIIPIEDYWLSIDRYINWSATAVTKNDFYTDYTIRQLYKDHLRTYVNRVNSVNNRTYSEDPTIYAWDLLNEPRCTGCGYALQTWLEEMSVYMKSIDPNHMVGLGSEGFYSTTCDRVYLNPGAGQRRTGISSSPWAAQEGQDFLANGVVPDIDFATNHIWMDNWMGYADFSSILYSDLNFDYTHGGNLWMEKLDYTVSWLQAHIQDAGQLGKPLLTEEFGKAISAAKVYTGELPHSPEQGETVCANDSIRDIFFQTIYGLISESAQSGGPAQGSNFWNLYTVGIADDDPFKVTLADNSTMAIVAAHQANMSAVVAKPGTCPGPYNAATSVVFDTASGPASGDAQQNTTTSIGAVPPSLGGLGSG